jgi:multiple sugar transport system substrate-binding protein
MTTLRGITWNHTRGFLPMVATAQRYEELHPGVRIEWEKRSLQAFADHPIEELAERYDLLVIDHPHAGLAAARPALAPLEELLPAEFLRDQAARQVGRSHDTYRYGGRQWALAIDAAAPVASWRPDRMAALGAEPPRTWDELLALARRGVVAVPAIPIDALMNVYALCVDQDATLFASSGRLVEPGTGLRALERLRELVALCPPDGLERNPIRVYEALVSDDHPAAYCPFAYGYSNYARDGYAARRLDFGDVPAGPGGRPLRTVLGGTGLAISRATGHPDIAADYAVMVASPDVQRGLYLDAGGQPGHRAAWEDERANRVAHGFFRDTLSTLDRAYVRPRYHGYMGFQDAASPVVHAVLTGGIAPAAALERLEELYRASLAGGPPVERMEAG